jgi:hypothetical protein
MTDTLYSLFTNKKVMENQILSLGRNRYDKMQWYVKISRNDPSLLHIIGNFVYSSSSTNWLCCENALPVSQLPEKYIIEFKFW